MFGSSLSSWLRRRCLRNGYLIGVNLRGEVWELNGAIGVDLGGEVALMCTRRTAPT